MKYKILKKVLVYMGGGGICGYIYRSLKKYTLLTIGYFGREVSEAKIHFVTFRQRFLPSLFGFPTQSPERRSLAPEDKLCSKPAVRTVPSNFGFGLLCHNLPLFI